MFKKRSGFSMIELVFVIVVLGILAAVAVPRLAATRDDAHISAGASTVAAVRSGIVALRQQRILAGVNTWPVVNADFGNVLSYAVTLGTSDGDWQNTGATTWNYFVAGTPTAFTYTIANGQFTCTPGAGYCNELTQ